MIPTSTIDYSTIETESLVIPSGSWRLSNDFTQCNGKANGLTDLKQCIYFMLSTERNKYFIYNWDYGLELQDLFGESHEYVIGELQLRIRDCLLQDDRITDVSNFEFTSDHNKLHVSFTVYYNIPIYGSDEFYYETEVVL